MSKQSVLTALALATGLALAGCSGSSEADGGSPEPSPAAPDPTTPPTTEPVGQPAYDLDQAFSARTAQGAQVTVDFTAEAPADVESYRQAAGGSALSYAEVDLDNGRGGADAGIAKVVLVDEQGRSVALTDVLGHVDGWTPTEDPDPGEPRYVRADGTPITEAQHRALEEQGSAVRDAHRGTTSAGPQERVRGHLAAAAAELPERVTTIELWPAGTAEDPIRMLPVPEQDPSGDPPSAEPAAPEPGAATGTPGGTEPSPAPVDVPAPSAEVGMPGAMPDQDFTYEEAYAAWQGGMPYYDAFCLNYEPTTPGGVAQCEGIEDGTVDKITGEYIGG